MSVPDYQSLMLPLLKLAEDDKEHGLREDINSLAVHFGLTDEDRGELLPSGRQAKFDNRVGWARTYLKKAGLLQSPRRGKLRITQRGRDVLRSTPLEINAKFLRQFPEFVEFQEPKKMPTQARQDAELPQTPEEVLESSYHTLRVALTEELLERIMDCSPAFFERLVVDLLVAMGYGGSHKDAAEAVGGSRDGGVDGIIKEDKLGLDVVYIQAKRWQAVVGRPIVQTFAGTLAGFRARKGVLITTSRFSKDAKDYVSRIERKIVLIDGQQLAQLMLDHGIGVTDVASYTVSRVDLDYFSDELSRSH